MTAPQEIGQACQSALAALAPGQSPEQAQLAFSEATAQLDAALGATASLPGIADLRDAFVSAGQSLTSGLGAPAVDSSRLALDAACSVFTSQ